MNCLGRWNMVLTNIRKHKVQSLLNILISIAVILFISLYFENLRSTKEQLANLSEIIPVYGHITNPTGEQRVGLEIASDLCQKFERTDLITDLKCTLRLTGGEGRLGSEQWRQVDIAVIAANNIAAVTGIKGDKAERYNKILEGNKKQCLVNRSIAKSRGWSKADKILLTFYYYQLDSKKEMKEFPLCVEEFEIVDMMENIAVDEARVQPDILIPIKAAEMLFDGKNIPYTFDSLGFTVANPLELNKFKEVMQEWNLFTVSPQASTISEKGTALYLKDENFIAMANQLMEQIQILKSFVPVLIVILVLLETVLSFLLVQGRKQEIVIQRILGMSGREVRRTLISEQVFSTILAGVFCFALGIVLKYSIGSIVLGDVLVFAGCFTGSYMNLSREERIPIMKRMSQNI